MNIPTVTWDSLPKVTGSQMSQVFMLASGKYGFDVRLLIEHAARDLASLVAALCPDGPVLVVAGRGHNGAGGLATARLLASRGRKVWVVPTHEAENYSGVPREQLECLKHFSNVRVKTSLPKMKFSCTVDAAIGSNLEGPPRGRTQDVITVLNNMNGCTIVSLDAPTGLDVNDGSTPGDVVNATATLTLGMPKLGVQPGANVGDLYLADLGLPRGIYDDMGLQPIDFTDWISRVTN